MRLVVDVLSKPSATLKYIALSADEDRKYMAEVEKILSERTRPQSFIEEPSFLSVIQRDVVDLAYGLHLGLPLTNDQIKQVTGVKNVGRLKKRAKDILEPLFLSSRRLSELKGSRT